MPAVSGLTVSGLTVSGLTVSGLTVSFGSTPVLHTVDLAVPDGQITAILGPSGSGKTTLLRAVAGLVTADEGSVAWNGENLTTVAPHRRDFSLMFQDHALFGHRDVGANVEFGLRMRGWSATERARRTHEVLSLVGLAGFDRRRVTDLSGGEQQRVALARALAPGPRLLMLDEPLAAVDRERRDALSTQLSAVLRATKITTLLVTHDLDDAFSFADHVVLIDQGRVIQSGPSAQVWHQPVSVRAARFLGVTSMLDGHADRTGVETPWGTVATDLIGPVQVGFRAASIVVDPKGAVTGSVTACTFRRDRYAVAVATPTGLIDATSDRQHPPGSVVSVTADLTRAIVLPA